MVRKFGVEDSNGSTTGVGDGDVNGGGVVVGVGGGAKPIIVVTVSASGLDASSDRGVDISGGVDIGGVDDVKYGS